MRPTTPQSDIARYADMFAAMGTHSRLRIMRVLLSAHPAGLVVGNIQKKLGLAASTLLYHLKKLHHKQLLVVHRDGVQLWCSANMAALEELFRFLYSECCTRNRVFSPEVVVRVKSCWAKGALR